MIRYTQQGKTRKRTASLGIWHAGNFGRRKRAPKMPWNGSDPVEGAVFRIASRKEMMRVLLRDSKTRKYLRADHRWTANPAQAQDFHHGWGATDVAFTMKPQRLVIVYQFGDERYDIGIPAQRIPSRTRGVHERTREKTQPRSYRRHCSN